MGMWGLRKVLAAIASSLVMLAYVTCIAIAKARGTYTGGLVMPYFSDIGRDKETGEPYPQVGGYYVFAVFITTAAALLLPFMVLQYLYVKAWARTVPDASLSCRAVAALVCGLLAPWGAALLSIFNTTDYPDLHAYAAYAFFVFIVLYGIFTLLIYRTLASRVEAFKPLMLAKYIAMGLLGVAFILYIPVGLAIVSWTELSMEDCLAQLDPAFCEANAIAGTNLTGLFDYSGDLAVNTMRSSTQFICVISIMVFIFLHVLDPNPPIRQSVDVESNAQSLAKS